MHETHVLRDLIVYLSAGVLIVPLFRALRLGSILGYLAAGAAIGPWGLGLVPDAHRIMYLAEFGVVFLLFIIGLELKPKTLWSLRKPVFGLGGAQVAICALAITLIIKGLGFDWKIALVIGMGLALSSTAFAMQMLHEYRQSNTLHGRTAFAILLFQDLAVIPLMALIPFLGGSTSAGTDPGGFESWAFTKGLLTIIGIVVGGHFLLRHLFRAMAYSKLPELFTAASLLLVLGISAIMHAVGLSMALGAFLAGVLLADSEYRHEIEASIEPFKGLLLGLFFIAVGMTVNFGLVIDQVWLVVFGAIGLITIKAIIIFLLARVSGLPTESARNLMFSIGQGGEFAFVLFGVATVNGILSTEINELLIAIVTLSMALTPSVFAFNQRFLKRFSDLSERPYDNLKNEQSQVIVAGFGRFGQIVTRILKLRKISFTTLEHNPGTVDIARKWGAKIYYGDASRLDLLTAAGAADAKIFVLAIDDVDSSVQTARMVREHFPHLTIIARARNRRHAYDLMELGVEIIKRETYLSSLAAARDTLVELGTAESTADHIINKFRVHDEKVLKEQLAHRHDEASLINYTTQAGKLLEQLLEADDKSDQSKIN